MTTQINSTATNTYIGAGGNNTSLNVSSTGLTTGIVTASDTVISSQNGGQLAGFRNNVINGAFDVWQRGTSFIGTAYNYCADRWMCVRSAYDAGMTVSRVTSDLAGFRYVAKIQRDSGNTLTSNMFLFTCQELVQSIPLQGKTVTLSFWAKAGANYTGSFQASCYTGTTGDQAMSSLGAWTGSALPGQGNPTLTTTWTRFQYTFTLGSTVQQIGIQFARLALTGTAGADDSVYLTGVQMEIGAVATPFEYRPYGTELALCQRYYYRIQASSGGSYFGMFTSQATNNYGYVGIQLPVSMRANPTTLEQSGTAGHYQIYVAGSGIICNSVPVFSSSNSNTTVLVNVYATSGHTAGQSGILFSVTGQTPYLAWSAEL